MAIFETLLLLMLGAVLVSALARRIGAPYPSFLALAGAGLALAPIAPYFTLDPNLALALFVAPVLLDSAYDASARDLRRHWLSIGALALFAVAISTVVVACVAKWLMPGLPWAAACALGALVAPPDAAAATAVLRQVRLPHRIVVVLEGESLFNDASALLVYRIAVGATLAGTSPHLATLAPTFAVSLVGSLALGIALAFVMPRFLALFADAASSIILQFVTTFGVWILAERLGLSPILTMVAYALTLAQTASGRMPARLRVPSYAVWDTAVLVLNTLAFVLIGLQLRPILAGAPPDELRHWLVFAGLVLLATILARFAWVLGARSWSGLLGRDRARGWAEEVVIGWCGMRGIVTLAAALALPPGFPQRGLMLFTAFAVALGTLVIQGLTLRPLLSLLRLQADGPVEHEVRKARILIADAAMEALADEEGPEAEALRREIDLQRATAIAEKKGREVPVHVTDELRRRTLRRSRERLHQLRHERVIGDDAFHRVEEDLDFADLAVRQTD